MSENKLQTHNFYDFVVTVASDQKMANQMLLDNPGWLHSKSLTGETAMHYLVIENDLEAVKFLIQKGAEVDTKDTGGRTPLMHAAQLSSIEMCFLLMQAGADVNYKDDLLDYTPLHYAAIAGEADLLDAMLAAGGQADARDEFGESVADVVSPRKRTLLLNILKKHGYS